MTVMVGRPRCVPVVLKGARVPEYRGRDGWRWHELISEDNVTHTDKYNNAISYSRPLSSLACWVVADLESHIKGRTTGRPDLQLAQPQYSSPIPHTLEQWKTTATYDTMP